MADIDYSKLSDAELNKLIEQTRAEISSSKPKEESSGGKSVSELSDKELNDMIRNTRREALREEGKKSVQDSMKAEPEYIEVPSYDATGMATGYTERVLKPTKSDPIGRGALSVLPFGEDLGAWARSSGGLGMPGSGRTMSEEKDVMQGEKEAAKAAYPGPFLAGQAAGIVPQMYLPMGLASQGSSALGRTALGAAEGAGYGAVTGFGEGNTLEERLGAAKSGAITGGVLGGALGRFAAPAERAAPAVPEIVNAAERLNVPVPRYAVTESMPLQQVTKISENIPLAGEPLIAARKKTVQALDDAVNNLVPKMDTRDAGQKIGEGIKNWMTKGVSESGDKMYTEVRSLFTNPEAAKRLENTSDVIADIMARDARSGIEGVPKEIQMLMGGVNRKGGLDFEGAKNLMTQFRSRYQNDKFAKTIDIADYQRLYKSLSNDVLDIAEAAGGEPARHFLQKADREYAALANTRKKLEKIVGSAEGQVNDEKIFNRLFDAASSGRSADNTLLARAVKVMEPEHLRAFQAGILSKLGRDQAGNFSPERWLGTRGIEALAPRARSMIFKDEPKLMQAIKDVTEISKGMVKSNKFGNPSGTGRTTGLLSSIGAGYADPVSTLAGLAGANVFTRVMSKPSTAENFAKWSRRYENYVKNPTRSAANSLYREGLLFNRILQSESDKPLDINEKIKLKPQ